MKTILILILFSSSGNAHLIPCNQIIYDGIYKNIIQRAIASELTNQDLLERNRSIETLRDLCQGQKSTYETKSAVGNYRIEGRHE